ncbi:MAG TPA: MCE family protein, partial [Phenylobacterium sp.]|nr:MCE family protein [Phenylobacterium sp.]
DGKRAVKNLADATDEAKEAAKEARAMIARLQGPTSDFATNGLPQVTAAVIQLQSAAESLERLVNDIEASPTSTLGKGAAQEVKVPQ